MKSAIISIGTELLMGQIVDTNAVFLAQGLNGLGIDVLYRYTVGDNDGRLAEVLELAFRDCDLVVTTGGLGPTEDDMTKETVARFMGDHLIPHPETLESLRRVAAERKAGGRGFSENNFRQADVPSRAVVFPTNVGTAPGFALSNDDKTKMIICMPGPPREMTDMFRRRVRPFLAARQTDVIYYQTLREFGIGESMVEEKLLDLIDAQTDPTIATYAKTAECTIRVASKRRTEAEAREAVQNMCDVIRERLWDAVYSDQDEEMVFVVGRKLIDRHISISCAESMTGGLFAARLTDVPGISEVFDRGLVTYTEKAKIDELGVSEKTLASETAVSPNVARQMADGLARKTGSDICVTVTGIAGPGGGTPEKPVGLFYVGCAFQGKTIVKKVDTRHQERDFNRAFAVLTMLDVVNRLLDGREVRGGDSEMTVSSVEIR